MKDSDEKEMIMEIDLSRSDVEAKSPNDAGILPLTEAKEAFEKDYEGQRAGQ